MKQKIQKYLAQLEAERDIKILLACETGSRAWGFPSPDSDYDVRLIYMHREDWYLKLSEPKDTIELMLDNNEIDITGWDLRKSLQLLLRSNASLLERMQSPIVYQADNDFVQALQKIAQTCYSRIATMHHYRGLAKKAFEELHENDDYKLKKLFYALRAATACRWIIEREDIPPIEFVPTLEGLSLDAALVARIKALIAFKATRDERYRHQGEAEIFHFIKECLVLTDANTNSLPSNQVNMEQLNQFFIQTLRNQWI